MRKVWFWLYPTRSQTADLIGVKAANKSMIASAFVFLILRHLRSSIFGALTRSNAQFLIACGIFSGIVSVQAVVPPDYLSVATGVYNLLQDRWRTMEFDVEYKFHLKCLQSPNRYLEFRPLVGALGTLKGTIYAYVGINFDLLFFDHLLFAPGFAAGYFSKGNGRDLGYPIEFRSGVELAWQFCDQSRLGIHFYHLSNASIGDRNPGEESFVLFYDIPIVRGFPFGTCN